MNIKYVGQKPTQATPGSAGYDVRSTEEVIIAPGNWKGVDVGLKMSLPIGMVALIFPRSGLAFKNGVSLVNGVGVGDSDFTDSYKVGLINHGKEPLIIRVGDRVGQLIFLNYSNPVFEQVDQLEKTERVGGFGSTGTN